MSVPALSENELPPPGYFFRERPPGVFRILFSNTLEWSLPGDILRVNLEHVETVEQAIRVTEYLDTEGFKYVLTPESNVLVLDTILTIPANSFEALGFLTGMCN